MSPPRSGLRLLIAPPEYRRLRGFARLHLASGILLACLALITLSLGGNDAKTYLFTMVFLAGGVAHLAFASWELSILRSQAAGT
jgi:hypothetical protein